MFNFHHQSLNFSKRKDEEKAKKILFELSHAEIMKPGDKRFFMSGLL